MSGINDYDPALLRVLAHLHQKHPTSLAPVALFGNSVDTETTIRSVYQLGFDLNYSASESSFAKNLKCISSGVFVLIVGDEIPKAIAAALLEACDRIDPLYVARTYSGEGINPETKKYYKSIFHCFDPVSQTPAAIRVSRATYELYYQANEEAIDERPISPAMREKLGIESKFER